MDYMQTERIKKLANTHLDDFFPPPCCETLTDHYFLGTLCVITKTERLKYV